MFSLGMEWIYMGIDSLGYLASAGSGKTFSLSARYVSLLFWV